MKYDNTNLPENIRAFLEEIINDEKLCDAFYSRDVEIYDEAWVKDLEDNFQQEFEDLMGPGDSSYKNIKAFARDGTGALWVVLDDELIGYISTEGQCGIVSRNINEFMNIIAALKGSSLLADFWDLVQKKLLQRLMKNPMMKTTMRLITVKCLISLSESMVLPRIRRNYTNTL